MAKINDLSFEDAKYYSDIRTPSEFAFNELIRNYYTTISFNHDSGVIYMIMEADCYRIEQQFRQGVCPTIDDYHNAACALLTKLTEIKFGLYQ